MIFSTSRPVLQRVSITIKGFVELLYFVVFSDTTVQVILTPNQLARAPLDIIALVGHLHQPSLSHPKVTFLVRQLLRPSSALWELTKRYAFRYHNLN